MSPPNSPSAATSKTSTTSPGLAISINTMAASPSLPIPQRHLRLLRHHRRHRLTRLPLHLRWPVLRLRHRQLPHQRQCLDHRLLQRRRHYTRSDPRRPHLLVDQILEPARHRHQRLRSSAGPETTWSGQSTPANAEAQRISYSELFGLHHRQRAGRLSHGPMVLERHDFRGLRQLAPRAPQPHSRCRAPQPRPPLSPLPAEGLRAFGQRRLHLQLHRRRVLYQRDRSGFSSRQHPRTPRHHRFRRGSFEQGPIAPGSLVIAVPRYYTVLPRRSPEPPSPSPIPPAPAPSRPSSTPHPPR